MSILGTVLRRGTGPFLKSASARRLVRKVRSKSIAIVMYHGVVKQPLSVFNWCQLQASQFEEQIAFLSHEYHVVPLAEALDRISSDQSLPEGCAVLTFDDGFRNFFTTAYPILARYQLPATVFVITSLPETRQPAWPDQLYFWIANSTLSVISANGKSWPLESPEQRCSAYRGIAAWLKSIEVDQKDRILVELGETLGVTSKVPPDSDLALMDWNEIEQLAKSSYIGFGSHSHTHQILSRCSLKRQREELESSRRILCDHVGNADLFAYPNGNPGDFTNDTKHLLAELGYRCGLSTIPGLNDRKADVFELRRVPVGADTTLLQFDKNMLLGG